MAIRVGRSHLTYADFLALPDDQRTRILDELERVARDDFGDAVVRPYQSVLYLAERRAR